jgi:hypothetical protein
MAGFTVICEETPTAKFGLVERFHAPKSGKSNYLLSTITV